MYSPILQQLYRTLVSQKIAAIISELWAIYNEAEKQVDNIFDYHDAPMMEFDEVYNAVWNLVSAWSKVRVVAGC